jgi:hypothetical protein
LVEWWKEALDKWGAVLSFTYEVFENDRAGTGEHRATGDWFRSRSEWCVQLDMLFAARIHRDACGEAIQQALSLTLLAVQKTQTATANQELRDIFTALSNSTREQLQGMLQKPETPPLLPDAAFREPGYFFWIRFKHDDFPLLDAGVQTEPVIEEIVEAWIAGGWYMWFADGSNVPGEFGARSVLLYQTCESIAGMIEDEEIETGSSEESARIYAESVSAMLESDASIASLVLVSRKVQSPVGIFPALAMLVLASRTAKSSSYTPRVSMFDDQLLLHWLQLLPRDSGQLLMNWMNFSLKTDSNDSLVQETEEMLDGLVSANLNISEAARMLYLHRNTLIHRIERIKQSTGLDIRNFFDAVQLWIVLKVK